jgi:hypothetical protein
MGYVGLGIALAGIALLFVALWFDFGLAVKVAALLLGIALVYGGWLLTERGQSEN